MSPMSTIKDWLTKYAGTTEALYLICVVVLITLAVVFLGLYLSPIITALIFAFVLNDVVEFLTRLKFPRPLAIFTVVALFLGLAIALFLGILPLVSQQLEQLINNIPALVDSVREIGEKLSTEYPDLFSPTYLDVVIDALQRRLTEFGGAVIQGLFTQIPNFIAVLVFLALVPICLFFLLKDRRLIVEWVKLFVPNDSPVLERVGKEMSHQISRYIRGKFIEICLVGLSSYVVFELFGLNYAVLLGLLVGLSVIVPFIGAVLVTIPVLLVAILQFGWSLDLLYVLIAYSVIQVLDGNVLVPVLFSKAVNLHPIAIIAAVLVFGGLWGIWGVFFAIPLALLIKTLMEAWPRAEIG